MTMPRKRSGGVLPTLLVFASVVLAVAPAAAAYTAFPGQYPARVTGVESPMVVALNVQTWPGFRRDFRITLPGIRVPEDSPEAPTCRRELAEQALTFTETFLYEAERVEVTDIVMDHSAAADGKARIRTEQGDLADALQAAGLARPASVDPERPWCS